MDGDEPSDAQLLRAHVEGDPAAFAILVRRHQDRLWLTARSVLRNPDDANDALQDGLIRAFRAAHSWRGDGTVASWMHRIVSRVALNRAIKQSQRRTETLDEIPAELTAARDNAADGAAERVVQAVVAALPPDQRECFVRIDLLGFSFAEVAADLSLALGTVKSRRARGKARLLEALREAGLVGPNRPPQESSPTSGPPPEVPQQRPGLSTDQRRPAH